MKKTGELLFSAAMVAAASGLGILFREMGFPETNIVLVYLLAVVLAARFTGGYLFGILVSVAATLAFNYFFTSPYHSLSVDDPSYLITFAIMTVTSVITTTLTAKVKRNAAQARAREMEAQNLYRFTSLLSDAENLDQIAQTTAESIGSVLECGAAVLLFDDNGMPEPEFLQVLKNHTVARRGLDGADELKSSIEKLRTECCTGPEFCDWPINGKNRILGTVRIPAEPALQFTGSKRHLLHSMIECTALAIDRILSIKRQMDSEHEALKERDRSNLLRAISHDLRTPLTGIMGTAEMIMDMSKKEDPRYQLASDIYGDVQWLHSLVENILSMTKLREGSLSLKKQPEAVEEIIGSAVEKLASRAPDYDIRVQIPDELLMVSMDGKLIMQVLINLLDNAVKHTPPGNGIEIGVREDKAHQTAVFTVKDSGEGIAPADLPNIFKTFYTSGVKPADAKKGIGLGLAICRSIVAAHGGSIEGANRTDGPGAEFTFTLPLGEPGGEGTRDAGLREEPGREDSE